MLHDLSIALVANYQTQSNSTQYPQQLSSSPQTTHSSQPYLSTYEAPHHPQQYQHAYQPQISHPPPSVPQNAYHSPSISQQPPVEFPQIDSGLAVPVFLPGDDPIPCLNKAMEFMSTVLALRFLSTNNQLRTFFDLRNQAIIQDDRVTIQQVQGRQGQGFAGTRTQGNASSSGGNNAASKARVIKCYNCQGEGHMTRQCTQPKRPRKTDDLDAYDSNYDDISSAKAVLMANLSSYDSDVLSEVPYSDTYQHEVINQSALEMPYFEETPIVDSLDNEITSDSNIISYSQYLQESQQVVVQDTNSSSLQDLMIISMFEQMSEQMSNQATNWNKANQETKTVNESLTAKLERYKERVKTFEQRFNVDLNSREKLINSQMDDMIRDSKFSKAKKSPCQFDKVVKVRTTPDAITEGSWGFEHTKKVFKEEVIPFINSLRASFKDFENGLHSELNEVKMVFNQMEAAVDQYVMNIIMHADSVLANVLPADNKCLVNDNLEIERLEQENDHLFELFLSQDIVHICVNSLASCNDCRKMQQGYINEYNENLMLKAELAKKGQMVEKTIFDEVVLRCSRLENRNVNLELKLQHQKESFMNNKPSNNQNAPEILEFFKINE
ncbi:integrase, catalytic region, zinc finger, CCHC-type containing protein [Tanacetum coccineum]